MRGTSLILLGLLGCGTEVIQDETSTRQQRQLALGSYVDGQSRTCQFNIEPMRLYRLELALRPGDVPPVGANVVARVFVDESPTDDPADACEESELRWEASVLGSAVFAPTEPLDLSSSRVEFEAIFSCAGCDEPAPVLDVTIDYEPLSP